MDEIVSKNDFKELETGLVILHIPWNDKYLSDKITVIEYISMKYLLTVVGGYFKSVESIFMLLFGGMILN